MTECHGDDKKYDSEIKNDDASMTECHGEMTECRGE